MSPVKLFFDNGVATTPGSAAGYRRTIAGTSRSGARSSRPSQVGVRPPEESAQPAQMRLPPARPDPYTPPNEGGVDCPAVRRGRQHGRRYGGPASPRGMRPSDRDPSWLIATRGLFIWRTRPERALNMDCPRCDGLLHERTRVGVVVGICDRCRGMWLDRRELARISILLWQLEHEWIPDGETSDPAIRWGRLLRYPRRNRRRKPGRADDHR